MQTNTADEIVSQFFSAFRVLKQKLDLSNPIYHLTLAQMETLRMVGEKKRVLMKQVAVFLAITPPSATVLINHLVKLKLISRHSDPKDRRAIHLSLTPKGQSVLDKGMRERCKNFKKLLGNLGQKEQTEFLNILNKLINI